MQAERETVINRLGGRDRGFEGKRLPAASDIRKLHLWPGISLVMLKKGMQRGPEWAPKVSFFVVVVLLRDFRFAWPRMLPGTDNINSYGPVS